MRKAYGPPRATLAAVAVLLAACSTFGGGGDSTGARAGGRRIYSAYVLLVESPGGETVPFARVIVDPGRACPDLVGEAVGGAEPQRVATTPRRNPHRFAVRVCEARLPAGRPFSVDGGPPLPAVAPSPSRLVVFGDTGCKPKDQAGCTADDPAWPFPALVRSALTERPELVVHVGDYDYRGTPAGFTRTAGGKTEQLWYYDAGDGSEPSERCGIPGPYYSQNSSGNPDADRWEAWWSDFFEPAAPLLAAAPWVFARGNHELCSHAGPGWFYFLDPSSDLPEGGGEQLDCPPQDGEGSALPHLRFVEPQVLRLGDLDLAVLDSANACDELPGLTEVYRRQLAAVAGRLGGEHDRSGPAHRAWLITHRPVWGAEDAAESAGYACDGTPLAGAAPPLGTLNRTLQCALAGETGERLLPALDQVVAGHMHRFEALSFIAPTGRPPQLVVGGGGVAEDTGPPDGAFAQPIDGAPAAGFSVVQFGYLALTRDARGAWHGAMVGPDPSAWSPFLAPCGSGATGEAGLCVRRVPGAGPPPRP